MRKIILLILIIILMMMPLSVVCAEVFFTQSQQKSFVFRSSKNLVNIPNQINISPANGFLVDYFYDIVLEPNTYYTLSYNYEVFNNDFGTNYGFGLQFVDTNDVIHDIIGIIWFDLTKNFFSIDILTPSNYVIKSINFRFLRSNKFDNNFYYNVTNIQLEEGNILTPYEPYYYPNTTCDPVLPIYYGYKPTVRLYKPIQPSVLVLKYRNLSSNPILDPLQVIFFMSNGQEISFANSINYGNLSFTSRFMLESNITYFNPIYNSNVDTITYFFDFGSVVRYALYYNNQWSDLVDSPLDINIDYIDVQLRYYYNMPELTTDYNYFNDNADMHISLAWIPKMDFEYMYLHDNSDVYYSGYDDGYDDGFVSGGYAALNSYDGFLNNILGSVMNFFFAILDINVGGISLLSIVVTVGLCMLGIIIYKFIMR